MKLYEILTEIILEDGTAIQKDVLPFNGLKQAQQYARRHEYVNNGGCKVNKRLSTKKLERQREASLIERGLYYRLAGIYEFNRVFFGNQMFRVKLQ